MLPRLCETRVHCGRRRETCASHSEAATGLCERDGLFFPNDHGNLRWLPENGFAGVDAGWDFAAISAVTTPSPSFNPSTTSVTTPSLIPVLICNGVRWLPDKAYIVRSLV